MSLGNRFSWVLLSLVFAVAPAEAQRISEEALAELRRACGADTRRLCADVQPGEGRIIRCLRENYSAISPECRQAMTDANPRGRRR